MNFNDYLKKIFGPAFYFSLLGLLIAELLSYFGHLFLDIDHWFFALVVFLVLFLSLKNIKYGVWFVLLELFIGGKGYLLHLDIAGLVISLRLALWLVVLSVWTAKFLRSFSKKTKEGDRSIFLQGQAWKNGGLPYFMLLSFFALAGIVNGAVRNHDYANIFFDANGWLYLLLIFPFYEAFFNKNISGERPFDPVARIFSLSLCWLAIKTFATLFIFSHVPAESSGMRDLLVHNFYDWVRNTGTGEITTSSNFVRVFFQSHVFFVAGLYLALFSLARFWPVIKTSRKMIALFVVSLTMILGVILISYSRSFWVAAAAVLPFFVFFAGREYGWKKIAAAISLSFVSLVLAIGLIFAIVRFPVPTPSIDFNVADSLGNRTQNITGEAAASSRLALLGPLWQKITARPVFGEGFGATVTYKTDDPRILQQNPSGDYTTYAFEWGWLDIWLKLGLFGLLAYLFLLWRIIAESWKRATWLSLALGAGILSIAVTSIFSPYTNHPLGIGFLIVAAAMIYSERKAYSCAC